MTHSNNSKSSNVDVDNEIYNYLNLTNPKSFLLFAGAGSGKTRTLVNVLQKIRDNNLHTLIENGQKVAVITYTNAACTEIQHRLEYDSIFTVSTIHSFIWALINPFTSDIKDFLKNKLEIDIAELTLKIKKARDKNGKTALVNARRLSVKQKRLDELESIDSFIYSPTSNKVGRGTLNHSEVISIGAAFIADKKLMQVVLVNRYPILLIDESQDTNKSLLESFISVQKNNKSNFSLGLFGDTMQRIYSGGKDDLTTSLPLDWKTPAKVVNYRCPKRIVTLINNIRRIDDKKEQIPKDDAAEGVVKLFIADSTSANKVEVEETIRSQMVKFSKDNNWESVSKVKTLILEHSMASTRGEFHEFYGPLSTVDSLRDGALNGSNKIISFITDIVLNFINSVLEDDLFEIARIIKKNSLLLSSSNTSFISDPLGTLKEIDTDITVLKKILVNKTIKIRDVLSNIHQANLLILPDELIGYLIDKNKENNESEADSELATEQDKAWLNALNANLMHVQNYATYITGNLGYATHQGVKGLEFERVIAILDDEESRGFLFSYEKFFGAKELTKKDVENEDAGIDSTISRTRRLFYVICSRAEKSLAVVAYTKEPNAVKQKAIDSNWFSEEEIIILRH